MWSWDQVWHGSWAQRVPLRAQEAAPASQWANAARRWAADGCVVPELVDRVAGLELEQLRAAVEREQATRELVLVEQVLVVLVLAKVEQVQVALVQKLQRDEHVVLVQELQISEHVVLVLAKLEPVRATRSPATRALHNPHDPVAPAAVAQSADRSGCNDARDDRNDAKA